jgi:hypothetical protein
MTITRQGFMFFMNFSPAHLSAEGTGFARAGEKKIETASGLVADNDVRQLKE